MAFFAVLALAFCVFAKVLAQNAGTEGGTPPPPPFLQGAPQQKIEEFHDLLNNSGQMTDSQIEAAVKDWIGKQEDGIKTKFASFEEEKKKMESAQEQAHQAAIASFSPKAKEADTKLSEIATHQGLSAQEKAKQIQDFVNSLPSEVREEIEKAMQGSGPPQQ